MPSITKKASTEKIESIEKLELARVIDKGKIEEIETIEKIENPELARVIDKGKIETIESIEKIEKILITDDCHPMLVEGLQALGFVCDYEPDITYPQAQTRIRDYTGLIINSKIMVNRDFLDVAPKLRFVGRLGSGMEIVDRVYAKEKGVAVFSSPEGNRNAVAEQAMGMLLTLANNLLRADREVRAKVWKREANRGWELRGKTIGIIGFGHTGSQFARKLAGFEVNVLAYDKYKSDYAADMPWVKESDVAEICANADIISLHLPLNPETRHFVQTDFIERCKPKVIIINTSRGNCVKTDDLVAALERGRVGGACLDVFENEKTGTFTDTEHYLYDRLYALENVVLAPHVAGWTHESKRLLATVLLEKITLFLSK